MTGNFPVLCHLHFTNWSLDYSVLFSDQLVTPFSVLKFYFVTLVILCHLFSVLKLIELPTFG